MREFENSHDLRFGFIQSVERFPNRPALGIGHRVYTYAESSDIARRWAAGLMDAVEGRSPQRVGIFASRSETSYLGVMACLFAGAAFVPLNPQFPIERTQTMCEQADLDALIVDDRSAVQLPSLLAGLSRIPAILLPETNSLMALNLPTDCCAFTREDLAKTKPLIQLPEISPDDLAYLLFTSGSTGKPKGVPIAHANVRAFLNFSLARYSLTPEDRLTQTFDQTFDLSIFDLFMAWESGASFHSMHPFELLAPIKFVNRRRITVWFSVPSVAGLLLKQDALKAGSMPDLRWSLFCGEGLPRVIAEAWQAAAPQSTVENLYGPTELTVACAAYRWDPVKSPSECVNDLVPIGEVFPSLSSIVINDYLSDVPVGEVGELCITGPQMFQGYWRAPELSAGCFLEREEPRGTKVKYYRTGDLVSRHDERYAYLGREDTRIKMCGYRIELGEIEAILRRRGCVDAVVVPCPERRPEYLTAFVSGNVEIADLFAALRRSLPGYMVPRTIVSLETLPLNKNSKIDRGALRQMACSAAGI